MSPSCPLTMTSVFCHFVSSKSVISFFVYLLSVSSLCFLVCQCFCLLFYFDSLLSCVLYVQFASHLSFCLTPSWLHSRNHPPVYILCQSAFVSKSLHLDPLLDHYWRVQARMAIIGLVWHNLVTDTRNKLNCGKSLMKYLLLNWRLT